MEYYKRVQNKYGLPLDNRATYTKLDWVLWTATLTQERADFEALLEPVILFLNETPDHSPMTDWYQTKTARKVGFTARPVVGGVLTPNALRQMPRGKSTRAATKQSFRLGSHAIPRRHDCRSRPRRRGRFNGVTQHADLALTGLK